MIFTQTITVLLPRPVLRREVPVSTRPRFTTKIAAKIVLAALFSSIATIAIGMAIGDRPTPTHASTCR